MVNSRSTKCHCDHCQLNQSDDNNEISCSSLTNGKVLDEQADIFPYLGSLITNDTAYMKDIQMRLSEGYGVGTSINYCKTCIFCEHQIFVMIKYTQIFGIAHHHKSWHRISTLPSNILEETEGFGYLRLICCTQMPVSVGYAGKKWNMCDIHSR